MDRVRVGDVLKSRSGRRFRVVREIGLKHGRLYNVTLAIRHCSWTRRCYTILTYNDLYQFGYRPTGRRMRLTKTIDREIAACINFKNRFRQRLTCCDVEGVS